MGAGDVAPSRFCSKQAKPPVPPWNSQLVVRSLAPVRLVRGKCPNRMKRTKVILRVGTTKDKPSIAFEAGASFRQDVGHLESKPRLIYEYMQKSAAADNSCCFQIDTLRHAKFYLRNSFGNFTRQTQKATVVRFVLVPTIGKDHFTGDRQLPWTREIRTPRLNLKLSVDSNYGKACVVASPDSVFRTIQCIAIRDNWKTRQWSVLP